MTELAAIAAFLFAGGLILEHALLRWRFDGFFFLGFPLHPELVPIPSPPEGSGRTSSVHWEVNKSGDSVRFWAIRREAPMCLRGAVRLVRTRGAIRLAVTWSPPWSPLLAAAWLAAMGFRQDQGLLMVSVAGLMVLGILAIYRSAALRAAAELRWAWVQGDGDTEDGDP
jgi:hypothetical protein